MKLIFQILLSPFSLVYGIVVFLRNKLFDIQLLKSKKYESPILIGVGNLAVGGTGKTPHVEHIIQLLIEEYKCAILSRGYGRSSKGYKVVSTSDNASEVGDEPLQYKLKYENIVVAVDEQRVHGVEQLRIDNPDLAVVVLDDVYQHRSVQPNLNVLITDFSSRYTNDYLLPSGRLREWRCGSKRADIIVVSKCPRNLDIEKQKRICMELNPLPHQKVFFSAIEYGELTAYSQKAKEVQLNSKENLEVVVVSGIANPIPFIDELNRNFKVVKHFRFRDHYTFTRDDIRSIRSFFEQLEYKNKIIISTEKDIMRLSLPALASEIDDLPLFYVPIKVTFLNQDGSSLEHQILDYVRTNKRD